MTAGSVLRSCYSNSSVAYVVALLAGQPIHAENMHTRGYGKAQIAFHKTGVRNSWRGEHENYGTDGIRFSLMAWGSHYISCSIVRLEHISRKPEGIILD